MPTPTTTAEPDAWSLDIARLYSVVRRDNKIAYGPWAVEKLEGPAVTALSTPHDYVVNNAAYRVRDLNQQTIVVCQSKALAELIATLPDLCDNDLRPSSAASVTCEVSGRATSIPFVGTADPQAAFDSGYHRGHQEGWDAGWAAAHEPEPLEPCGDSGVA